MSEPFLGEIRMAGFNFAPRGWAFCNGQLMSIAQNSALFALLGTTYGGDGITTFALPNLQGRVPMHWGNGAGLTPRTIGETAGTETVTLISTQMPAHTHALACNSASAGVVTAVGNFPGTLPRGGTGIYASTADSAMSPLAVGAAGGSQPHDNTQPFLCVSFIIALEGIFPSRN